jgi:hypothetical protein
LLLCATIFLGNLVFIPFSPAKSKFLGCLNHQNPSSQTLLVKNPLSFHYINYIPIFLGQNWFTFSPHVWAVETAVPPMVTSRKQRASPLLQALVQALSGAGLAVS